MERGRSAADRGRVVSSIADQVAAEHRLETYSTVRSSGRGDYTKNHARCTCGHSLPWYERTAEHAEHRLDAVEAATRAQIAADIVAWPDTPLGKDTLARGAWS